MASIKVDRRNKIRQRIRNKIAGTADTPRLSVFRSNKGIYCQVINDLTGETLAQANSSESGFDNSGTKSEQAKRVGLMIAERCKAKQIENIVFDRGGYLYHGRVRSLAEGAREGGLSF